MRSALVPRIAWILLLALASTAFAAQDSEPRTKQILFVVMDRNMKVVEALPAYDKDGLQKFLKQPVWRESLMAEFPVVVGSLWGMPEDSALERIPIRPFQAFQLDLGRVEQELKSKARPPNELMTGDGLEISPREVRTARLGTFVFDTQQAKTVGGAGFFEAVSIDPVMLAYFDRPCEIHGLMDTQSAKAFMDVSIPAAGLYWLRATPAGDKEYSVKAVAADVDIVFGGW